MHVISQHYSYSCNDYIFYQNKILVMVAQKQLKIGTFLQRNSSDIRTDTLESLHWLSEVLSSLGIMKAQLRAPLKHPNMIVIYDIRRISRGPQMGSHDAERREISKRLSDIVLQPGRTASHSAH